MDWENDKIVLVAIQTLVFYQLKFLFNEIFNEREKEMVLEISKISRKLIIFKQALVAHGDVMHDAHQNFVKIFGSSFASTLIALDEFYDHIMRRLVSLTESSDELRETNHALVSTKEGETMKTLTIMAFVTYPLTLVASIFSMNARYTPIVGERYDFFIIIGIMAVTATILYFYFRYKRWF